ncbi:2-phospho-L-lactate guanylyltransferase [Sphingobium lactosutens]|uniref:2-phospho-L-lactate guanylyltransferase n=1 Tax=Sphingobium lactosutens TaxID=522773 RepID=UPI0015B7E224|nr:2-phospho-L-lactate guanylyltransferase [Sphingobium lactosutens]NWK94409.1 2-phospho-L-lactate guanylyltransferase [Sphingobium lactosutens]
MNGWTAIVPLKMGAMSKSRLTSLSEPGAREALAAEMARRVISCLSTLSAIDRTVLLSPAPLADCNAIWMRDEGRGLNAEIASARDALAPASIAIIFADLPMLTSADVDALLKSAADGGAIAPDRHGSGTNALALVDPAGFDFHFGTDSFARHRAQRARLAVVRMPGLANDLDTPQDLRLFTQ